MDLFNAVKCQKTESVKVFMTHIISKESNEAHSTIDLLMEAMQFFGFPMPVIGPGMVKLHNKNKVTAAAAAAAAAPVIPAATLENLY